ncbi:MAG: hypothetical protein R6X18_14835 [Chloroflexota bacterium]|jgi:hypothetical protein
MLRHLIVSSIMLLSLLAAAIPALASEGDPLANSVLLPSVVGWVMVGLALLLVVIFRLWAGRGPR